MRTTFVVVTVTERVEELSTLLVSIVADPRWDAYDLAVLQQGETAYPRHVSRVTQWFQTPERLGCHGARVHLLRKLAPEAYDAFINLDDDIVVGPHTNYGPMLEKAAEPLTGFVMSNWARTAALLQAKVPKMAPRFRPQIMLYNGGGMAYTEKIAALMRALPPAKTAFDCAWPITAYVNGYANYVYQGSLAVHRVCTTGGMSTFMAETPLHVMAQQWLTFRPAKKQDGTCKSVLIPLDKDVRQAAHLAHRQARERLT